MTTTTTIPSKKITIPDEDMFKPSMHVSSFDLEKIILTDTERKKLEEMDNDFEYAIPEIDIYWIEDDQDMSSELDVFIPIEYAEFAERITETLIVDSMIGDDNDIGGSSHMYEDCELKDKCTANLPRKYYRLYGDKWMPHRDGSGGDGGGGIESTLGVITGHFVHYELKHACADCNCRQPDSDRSLEGFSWEP